MHSAHFELNKCKYIYSPRFPYNKITSFNIFIYHELSDRLAFFRITDPF